MKRKFLEAVNGTLQRINRDWRIQDDDKMGVIMGQRALIALGQDAKPAIPELVRLMNDPQAPQTATHAAAVLANIPTEAAMPPLLAVLTNKTHPARWAVAINMSGLETNALPAIPALLQCLQDPNPEMASAAAISLGSLKLEPAIVIPALAKNLQHSNSLARMLAARSLGGFAARACPAVPALLNSLNDSDPHARRTVTAALQRIAPEVLTNAAPR